MANKFQNELIRLDDYYCSPNYNDDFIFARVSIYPDSMGLMNKHWGTFLNPTVFPYVGLYYETSPSSDILTIIPGECITGATDSPHGMNYTESLGVTLNYHEDFVESEDYFFLMGYVKDGDTVGEIYPDSYFITGIKSQSENFDNYIVYPNPTKNWLYFKPKKLFVNGISYSIRLRDIFGQLVLEETGLRSSLYAMDISSLKSGVYFYEIEESSGNIQKGKFIVK
jgi:hypothetical protein